MLGRALLSSILFTAVVSGVAAAPLQRQAKKCNQRDYTSSLLGLDAAKAKLTFTPDGTFKLVSFSDLHLGERWGDGTWADWGPANDAHTQSVHRTILDTEKPAFVVLNGDIVTGENLFKENATEYIRLALEPTVERGLRFATTYGNHDNANNINHQQIIEYEAAHYPELSYTRADVGPAPWGVGNFWVPVFASSEDTIPATILWFFDSRSFVPGTGNGPGPVPEGAGESWIDEESVPAYVRAQVQLMKDQWNGVVPPALVFTHIPFQLAQDLGNLPVVGDNDDKPPSVQGFDGSTYTGLDKHTFDALVESIGASNILAITSGHDHGNNWCARSSISAGVALCFNGHSGYGGYSTTNSKVRNGRVFELRLDALRAEGGPRVDSWNTYEDGTTGERVALGPDFMADFN